MRNSQGGVRVSASYFYLQKIAFLTEPYHIWLGSTLKINRRQTAVKAGLALGVFILPPNSQYMHIFALTLIYQYIGILVVAVRRLS